MEAQVVQASLAFFPHVEPAARNAFEAMVFPPALRKPLYLTLSRNRDPPLTVWERGFRLALASRPLLRIPHGNLPCSLDIFYPSHTEGLALPPVFPPSGIAQSPTAASDNPLLSPLSCRAADQ